jgi:DNA topoisomerase VI subunit B
VNIEFYEYDSLVLCKPGQRAGEYSLFTGGLDSIPARWNASEVILPEPRTITDMQILKMLGIVEQHPLKDVLVYNKTPRLTGFDIKDLVKMNSAYSEANDDRDTETSTDEKEAVKL